MIITTIPSKALVVCGSITESATSLFIEKYSLPPIYESEETLPLMFDILVTKISICNHRIALCKFGFAPFSHSGQEVKIHQQQKDPDFQK